MNHKDIKVLTDLLSKLEPGFLPYPIFEQVARLVALPIVEFIPLRFKDQAVEVLLIKRDADDQYWPNMLHTPGTVIRATDLSEDEDNYPAFKRIIHDELKDTKVGPPHYVGSILHTSKRGVEQAQLYWIELLEEPKVGSIFKASELPEQLIDSQTKFIKEAVRNFSEYLQSKT